jgi:hypothetical protein
MGQRRDRTIMNCPHGRRDGQPCHARACAQRRFPLDGETVSVSLLYCETCDEQIGALPKALGLSARTIRAFQRRHATCTLGGWISDLGWELICVDTGREIDGAGFLRLPVDSDDKKDALMFTAT